MTNKEKMLLKNEDEEEKEEKTEIFDPPDGGWGWMIVVAAGFSNFCILPVMQSFGLLFRKKFEELGITSSETTTIINMNNAVTACLGLANGPVFRKFSFRQVSLTGAFICALSITLLSTTKTFTQVLIFYSILYGAGLGFTMSANALALNTYFKHNRRVATGLSWTCTGMGPILMPQIITFLMPVFDMEGTVLIYGGFAFNAVACALLLQPVSWHLKKQTDSEKMLEEKYAESQKTLLNGSKNKSLDVLEKGGEVKENRLSRTFGSQYLYYIDKNGGASGLDILGPGTPMMSRANDGWYSRQSSNASLASQKTARVDSPSKQFSRSQPQSQPLSRYPSTRALSRGSSNRTLNRTNSEIEGWDRKTPNPQSGIHSPLIIVTESCEQDNEGCTNDNCTNEECMAKKVAHILENIGIRKEEAVKTLDNEDYSKEPREAWYKRFFKALVIFFDLGLLKDPVYVNLMLGITFANFTELNFSLLTPFILDEYGFTKTEISTSMSLLAGVDVAVRLTIPFVAPYTGWENKTFFLVGVCGMGIGRIVLAHVKDFYVTLAVCVLIGTGKALRTIFMALVIPSHVPLERLPAASGLQLVTSGIVFLTVGPVVGWIRDTTGNFVLMLHCLNIFTFMTAIAWSLEAFMSRRKPKK